MIFQQAKHQTHSSYMFELFIDSSEETTEQVVEDDDKQAKTGTKVVTSKLKEETDKAGNQKTGTKPKKALAGKVAKAGALAVAGTQQVSEEPSKIDETAGSVSKESDKKAATKSEPGKNQVVEKSDIKTESGMRNFEFLQCFDRAITRYFTFFF